MDRFKSILAVLTEDSLADMAFDRALGLARANGAALTLVDVVDCAPGELVRMLTAVSGGRGTEFAEDVLTYHRGRLADYAARASSEGVEVSEAVLQGVPFIEVIRMVLREGHDIVVKGAAVAHRGRGRFKGFDMHLLRKCPCPVWMLMGSDDGSPRQIVAAVDLSRDEEATGLDHKVLDVAGSFAERENADLHVAHAWYLRQEHALRQGRAMSSKQGDIDAMVAQESADAQSGLTRLMAGFPNITECQVHLIKGEPGDAITEFAKDKGIDLIVMGTVGRTGLAGFFMGGTAETILRDVECSVLALKPDGFESPVTLNGVGNGAS